MADEGYAGTKDCPCIVCGEIVQVTKFATASKVKCEGCKKEIASTPPEERAPQFAQWGDIKDPELRNLCCLSCGEDLVLTNVIKSDKWGDVVRMQCPSCFLVIQVSEQNRHNKWLMPKVPINHLQGGTYEVEYISDGEPNNGDIDDNDDSIDLCDDICDNSVNIGAPDVDIDVANSICPMTVQYLKDKYGTEEIG